MVKPMRKYVVGLRKIFNGSMQNASRRRLLAKMGINETTDMKKAEAKAALIQGLKYELCPIPAYEVFAS